MGVEEVERVIEAEPDKVCIMIDGLEEFDV